MTENIIRMVYRGIKYTGQKAEVVTRKFFKRELSYRGTKYVLDETPEKKTTKGRMCYRGTCY